MYTCARACVCIYSYTCVNTCIYPNICMHVHVHVHTYVDLCTLELHKWLRTNHGNERATSSCSLSPEAVLYFPTTACLLFPQAQLFLLCQQVLATNGQKTISKR